MPHSSYSAFKQYQTGRRISPVRGHAGRALSPPHGGTQHHTPHAAMIRSPHSPYEHTDASWEDASQQDYAPYHSPHDRRTRTRDTYRDREEESSHVFMHGRRSNGPPKRSWSAHSQPGRRPRSGSPKTPVRNNESSFGSHDNGQRLRFDEDHVWERDRVYDQQQSGSDGTPPRRREKGRRSPPRRESDRDRWHYERDRELFERRERELEDEVRRCKHQLHLANAEADALRRDLATRTEELSAAERELAAQRRDRGTSSRHRPSHKDAAPPMHLPPDAQSTAPPSPRRSLSSEARPQRPPKHITVQVPSQPLAEGVFTLRNGETLNGFPVWGCDDKRMYSGSREYWLITDESSDMAKSRGYVQSGKPHEGAMPHVITEWKIFDSEGWVQDRSVRVREGGTPVEKRETTRRANPSVEDTTYKPPRSTQLTKVPASVHQVQQPPAAYDSTPPGSANVSSTRLSWKGPPQRGPPQPQRTERERGTAPSLSVLSTRHATALQKGAQYWKYSLHRDAELKIVTISDTDGQPLLYYKDLQADAVRKRVPLSEIKSVSLGPLESRTFAKGPTKIRDAGMCFSISVGQAIIDLEAANQEDLVNIVTGISVACSASMKQSGQTPLTTETEVEAAQQAVRHLWANAEKFMTLAL